MSFQRLPDSEEPTTVAASGEVVRLLVGSALAVILLAGGVYWLRQHPVPPSAQQSGATVEVQLVPVPELESTSMAVVKRENTGAISPSSDPPLQEEASIAQDKQPRPSPFPASQAEIDYAPPIARPTTSETALKFREALLQHIARYQRYPAAARMQRLEGTVQVLFRLRRDGAILDAWVNSSSGAAVLDTEAISTLHRAEPLPPIPDEMPSELRIVLPIAFALR